jgi:hypothetical protein
MQAEKLRGRKMKTHTDDYIPEELKRAVFRPKVQKKEVDWFTWCVLGLVLLLVAPFAWMAMEAFGPGGGLVMLVMFGLGILFYFIPTLVAIGCKHRNGTAIFVLNLLLGWTFLGWVIALVWALVRPGGNSR